MDGTDYPANAVVCKLWGLVGSPVEFILALSVYKALSHSYESWTCWIYSDEEYRQQVADGGPYQIDCLPSCPNCESIKLVRWMAIFVPGLFKDRPRWLKPTVICSTSGRSNRRAKIVDAIASCNDVAFQSFVSPELI